MINNKEFNLILLLCASSYKANYRHRALRENISM
jgi:hypothetical protein